MVGTGEEPKYQQKNRSQCNFAKQKYHNNLPRIKYCTELEH